MTRRRRILVTLAAALLLAGAARGALAWVARERAQTLEEIRRKSGGGDPQEGRRLAKAYACGSCHEIPGVTGAIGLVGPPLDGAVGRVYLGGVAANDPETLVAWIVDPPSFDPRTAMPITGIGPEEARSVVAYLMTLD